MKFRIFSVFSQKNIVSPEKWGFESKKHLDIGCGANPRNPFQARYLIGADLLPIEFVPDRQFDEYLQLTLGGPIPLTDESVDSISGYDFIEHLSRESYLSNNLFISFMNEAHRILKPGGLLLCVTPAYPSPAAFQDPTHVNIITEKTVEYFTGDSPHAKQLGYGFDGAFKLIYQDWVGPFSDIFLSGDRKTWFSKLNPKTIFSRLRGIVSSFRNPTHLVWLLEKK